MECPLDIKIEDSEKCDREDEVAFTVAKYLYCLNERKITERLLLIRKLLVTLWNIMKLENVGTKFKFPLYVNTPSLESVRVDSGETKLTASQRLRQHLSASKRSNSKFNEFNQSLELDSIFMVKLLIGFLTPLSIEGIHETVSLSQIADEFFPDYLN